MTDAQTLAMPSRRDEPWRYADIDALETIGADALGNWREVTLGRGESWRECLLVDDKAPLLQRIRLAVGDNARAELFVTISGDASARIEVDVKLGEGSHFELGAVAIGGGDAVREFVTVTAHDAPGATSNQTVRAVQWDAATGNFLGEVKVARHAQKTDAAQDFKGLLLSDRASANAVPQLEIYADDVKCAHGATVGQLDEAARYYLAARGLPPERAKALLVQAFIGDAFVMLDDEGERDRLIAAALTRLEERTGR